MNYYTVQEWNTEAFIPAQASFMVKIFMAHLSMLDTTWLGGKGNTNAGCHMTRTAGYHMTRSAESHMTRTAGYHMTRTAGYHMIRTEM